ncbi:hypothetical protein ABPG72_019208 [Tetrahymena utriculariae]
MSSIRDRRRLKYHNNSQANASLNQNSNANSVYNQTIIMHSPQFSINNTFINEQNPNNGSNSNNQLINYYQINQQANIENINNQNMINAPQYYAKQESNLTRNASKNNSAQGKVYINRKLSHEKYFMNFFPPTKSNQNSIAYDMNENIKTQEQTLGNQAQYQTLNNQNQNTKQYSTIQYNSLQPPPQQESISQSKSKGKNSFRKNSVKRPSMNSPPQSYIPQPPNQSSQYNSISKQNNQQINKDNSSLEFQTAFVMPDNPQNLQNLFLAQNPDLGSRFVVEKKSKERLDKNIQLMQIYGNKAIKRSQNQIPILNQSGQIMNYYVPQEQRQSKSTGRHHSVLKRRQLRDSSNPINSCNESQTIQHTKCNILPGANFRSISHERQSLYSNLRQQNFKGYFESLKTDVFINRERQKSSAQRGSKQTQLSQNNIASAYQSNTNQVQIQSQQKQNSDQQFKIQNPAQISAQPQRSKSFGRSRAYRFINNSNEKQNNVLQEVLSSQQNQTKKLQNNKINYDNKFYGKDEQLMQRNDSGENINYQSQQSDYLEQYIGALVNQENMSTSNYDRLSSHMDKLSQKILTQQSDLKNLLQPLNSIQNSENLQQNQHSNFHRFSFDQHFDPNRSFNDLPSSVIEEKRQDGDEDSDKYNNDQFEEDQESVQGPSFAPSVLKKDSFISQDSKQPIQNYHNQSYNIKEDSHIMRPQASNIPQQQSHYSSINSFGCPNSFIADKQNKENNALQTINVGSLMSSQQVEVIEESFGSNFQPQNSVSNQKQSRHQSNIQSEIKLIDESIVQQNSQQSFIQDQQKQKIQPHPPQLQKVALRSQGSLGSQLDEMDVVGQQNKKQKQQNQQVTFCESPIIMEPKQELLAVADDKIFKRNAAKIYKRNDLLNKNTLKDSKDDIDVQKIQQMKLNLQFQVGDKKTLIPQQNPQLDKLKDKLTLQLDDITANKINKTDQNQQYIDDQGSDLNPVDEMSTCKEERNLLDDNEEVINSKKSIINSQFDQMIVTSLNNYLNKTETDQDVKVKSDGNFQHYKY